MLFSVYALGQNAFFDFFGSHSSYEAEANALFARMSPAPNGADKALINACIKSLKNTTSTQNNKPLWNCLDVLVMSAISGSSNNGVLNWISTSYNGSPVNSPTWTEYRGFTGASTKYLNTHYTPSTNGVNYTLNSASFFVYLNTNTVNTTYEASGGQTSGNDNSKCELIRPNGFDDHYYAALNSPFASVASTDRLTGLYTLTRVNSSNIELYIAANSKIDAAKTSTVVISQPLYVLAYDGNGGTATYFDNDRVACYGMGAGLSATDVANLNAIITTYLTAIGAN